VVSAVFVGLGNITAYIQLCALFSNAVNSKNQGWSLGILMSSVAMAFTLIGILANLLDVFSPEMLIGLAAGATVVSLVILWGIYRPLDARLPSPKEL
jgi:hypothetical protein